MVLAVEEEGREEGEAEGRRGWGGWKGTSLYLEPGIIRIILLCHYAVPLSTHCIQHV